MSRNYDTTNHKVFPRVTHISISYPESGVPFVTYDEVQAIVDGDNKVQHLVSTPSRYTLQLDPPTFTERIGRVSPPTGNPLPGDTSLHDLMLDITAVIRNDQKRRDAEFDNLENPIISI
jgi:hypothetical protein